MLNFKNIFEFNVLKISVLNFNVNSMLTESEFNMNYF